ncbi:hypothetical protein J4462_01230 [Candidatus Pacearchaeota archaeon]|nr:hypothetical protein [Candidatus Pacearchaeota archaeon]
MHEIDYSQRFPIIKLEFSSGISGISFPKNITRKRYVMQKNCNDFYGCAEILEQRDNLLYTCFNVLS